MEALEKAELDFWHGIHRGQPLLQKKYFGAKFKMYARVRADKYMSGCLRIMATAGA